MRTTLDIDKVLLRRLRAEAQRRGVPFKDVVAGALRRGLAEPAASQSRKPYRTPTFNMGAPRPGVNLDKALAFADALDDEERIRKLALGQ